MQNGTIAMLDSVLRSDSTVTVSERLRLMRRLAGGPEAEEPPRDRILRRAQAAEMLGRSVKSIDRMAAAGILRRIRFPGRMKAAGYRQFDVARLVAGEESGRADSSPSRTE